ncbi:MAG: DUF2235 domain-containing protein [Oceanicaulis sp.]|nr:DUF2235 domain-containing protein [Oceanicaulis sp.]
MKRLIVCCDGTWQRVGQPCPTNVVKIARAILPQAPGPGGAPVQQIVYYDAGVGVPFDLGDANWFQRQGANIQRAFGGLFGSGLEDKISAAYQFLAFNYEPGDEIYLFGFSRGAFTVRSLAGMIYCSGLLRRMSIHKLDAAFALYRDPDVKPASPVAAAFREAHGEAAPVRFLGCWDTVGMRGVPELPGLSWMARRINKDYRFHDCYLNRSIAHARHACAIDEDRKAFALTGMLASPNAGPGQVRQVWFAGDHGGVGGGEEASEPLSDVALDWMADQAASVGLGINLKRHPEKWFRPDPLHALPQRTRGLLDKLGHAPRAIPGPARATLPRSARDRYAAATPAYRPAALKPYQAELG